MFGFKTIFVEIDD
jgi:hypothetical protein